MFFCFTLTGCGSKVTDDPNEKKTKYDVYIVSGNMSEDKIEECLKYIKSINPTRDFCKGTERIQIENDEYTFAEAINHDVFTKAQLDYLASYEILNHYYVPPVIYEVLEWLYPIFKSVTP